MSTQDLSGFQTTKDCHVAKLEKYVSFKNRKHEHNIDKQCAFIHVGPENITMDAPTQH
jgi:hypothetical protein